MATTAGGVGRTRAKRLLSVVVPAFNEEKNVPHLYRRLCAVLGNAGWAFELIIVDDGSTDDTAGAIKRLHEIDPRVQLVSFTRNFGHQAALLAGLAHASGDVIISMDSDLQHPPELLTRMLALWQEGYDVVHTVKRTDASASLLRRVTSRAFYRLFVLLSGLPMGFGQSDFRLLDARVARELCRLPEYHKFLRGLVNWMGFPQITIEYDVAPRLNGQPTYSIRRRLQFHANALLSFSIIPLRLFTILGLIVSVPAALYGLVALAEGFYGYVFGYPRWIVPGWASLAIFVTFLGGIQLIGIGMLGEYLGRVFEQTKGRPLYVVKEAFVASNAPAPHALNDAAAGQEGPVTVLHHTSI